MTIPKITHQIWMQGWKDLPDKFQANVESLHELNPEYEHMKWDSDSLRQECLKFSSKCAERYDSFEHLHSKVDFGRYVVLYNYGGISVDTDMVSLRPIKDTPNLEDHDFLISELSYPANLVGMKNNAVIICIPKHPILKKGINTIINDKRVPKDFKVKEEYINETTGPIFMGKLVDQHKGDVKVLKYKYYEPCSPIDAYCEIKGESIMDHQHELSWTSPLYKFLLSLMYGILHYFKYFVAAADIIVVYYLYKYFSRKNKSSSQ